MSESIPDAQPLLAPSLDTAYLAILTKSPIQNVLVDGIDFAGMIMLDAFTLGCRGGIWMVYENIICNHQTKGYCGSSRVRDSYLVIRLASLNL